MTFNLLIEKLTSDILTSTTGFYFVCRPRYSSLKTICRQILQVGTQGLTSQIYKRSFTQSKFEWVLVRQRSLKQTKLSRLRQFLVLGGQLSFSRKIFQLSVDGKIVIFGLWLNFKFYLILYLNWQLSRKLGQIRIKLITFVYFGLFRQNRVFFVKISCLQFGHNFPEFFI